MTVPNQETQAQTQEPPKNDKELNFRLLEARYKKELEGERAARLEAEKKLAEKSKPALHDEDDDQEPYVDKRKLQRSLNQFGEQTKQQTKEEVQRAVQEALEQERMQNWLRNNSDFTDVMQHAEKIPVYDPELAESILNMPDTFERKKLVYRSIKNLGLHQPKKEEPTIQQKIDANKRGAFYQPTGTAAAPYATSGDFSPAGQKNAYDKMQALKQKLRLG